MLNNLSMIEIDDQREEKRGNMLIAHLTLSLSELRLCVIQRAIHHHPSSRGKVAKDACSHIQQEYHLYPRYD